MRVAVVTPWYPIPELPESGIFVRRDVRALAAAGHKVVVVHLDLRPEAAATEELMDGVPLIRVPFRRTSPGTWRRVREVVRERAGDADVIHCHVVTSVIPFAFRRPAKGQAWVLTEHWAGATAPETLSRRGRLVRPLLLALLRRPDVMTVVTENLRESLRRYRGRKPLRVVPCIVDPPAQVVERPSAGTALRLVGIGGIDPRKGPIVAVETVRELHDRGLDAALTWVGDGPLRAEMVDAAERLGIRDRVHLTGRLEAPAVAIELDAADMLLIPTLGDNFCVSVAEALTHGRPIVSGANTGAVDYADPRFSEFVAEQTATAYADAVERLRERTSAIPAREIAASLGDRFSSRRIAEYYVEAYREAAGMRARDR